LPPTVVFSCLVFPYFSPFPLFDPQELLVFIVRHSCVTPTLILSFFSNIPACFSAGPRHLSPLFFLSKGRAAGIFQQFLNFAPIPGVAISPFCAMPWKYNLAGTFHIFSLHENSYFSLRTPLGYYSTVNFLAANPYKTNRAGPVPLPSNPLFSEQKQNQHPPFHVWFFIRVVLVSLVPILIGFFLITPPPVKPRRPSSYRSTPWEDFHTYPRPLLFVAEFP